MISADVTIVRQGDPVPWPELDRDRIVHVTDPIAVALLAGGMASGAPSVALRVPLPDGRFVVAETSLAVLISVTAAARGAFPDAFAGGPFAAQP